MRIANIVAAFAALRKGQAKARATKCWFLCGAQKMVAAGQRPSSVKHRLKPIPPVSTGLAARLKFAGFLLCWAAASAALVDRVAVTVGNEVITETEILRSIELTAFLNGDAPSFAAEAKRQAAEREVEQQLIRREMELGHYPEAPDDQAAALLDSTAKNLGGEEEMERQLAALGLTVRDLEQHLLWQLTLVRFIDLRFRPAIQITAQDVQEYYQREIVPKQKPGEAVRLADVRERILETLSAQRADRQLDEWLKHEKAITRIEYKKEAFE
jgi:hypothetical protein